MKTGVFRQSFRFLPILGQGPTTVDDLERPQVGFPQGSLLFVEDPAKKLDFDRRDNGIRILVPNQHSGPILRISRPFT